MNFSESNKVTVNFADVASKASPLTKTIIRLSHTLGEFYHMPPRDSVAYFVRENPGQSVFISWLAERGIEAVPYKFTSVSGEREYAFGFILTQSEALTAAILSFGYEET